MDLHRLLWFWPLVFQQVSAQTGAVNITAKPGENVTLPCRDFSTKTILFVNWSRADLGPQYVLLYRDHQFDPENQLPSYQNRVELKDGEVSLILRNVTSNDNGTYECHVILTGGNRTKRNITLTVDDSGGGAGHTEDGGDKDGGDKYRGKNGGGDMRGHVGLVVAVLVFFFIGVWIIRKLINLMKKSLSSPPPSAV